MAKISRSEFLSNIRNIINESMNTTTDFDGSEKFGIRRYVSGLVEEGNKNPKLMSYLLNYDKSLNEGTKDFMLFAQFGQGLGQFAKGNRSVKAVIEQMNQTLDTSGNELETYMVIEKIAQPYVQKVIKEAYNTYIADKTPETMTNLIDSLDLLYESEPAIAQKLNVLITEEKYCTLEPFGNYMNESAFEELSRKMAKDNENKKLKEIQEKIDEYANTIFDNAIKENEEAKAQLNLQSIANTNNIGMNEAIKSIASSDAKANKRLMETIDEYAGALTNGAYEERLYETFITNLQKYTYLLPVEEAIKTITANVEKRNLPIMITKILEEMSETMSYYLIPLIEEDCARYVKEPNSTNRVQMRNALVPHAADPYVYAMLEAIDRDDTRTMNSISEKAISIKDQIKMIRQNASITNLYSPVQYIKENECVFNANGQFYVKKGNTLSKLDDAYLSQLSEKFVGLCQLVNDPRVVIDDDKIVLATNDKVAYIYEGYVDINGVRESRDTLRDLQAMCMKHDYDTNFYIMCSCLHENFNNIAKINFAKHVSLNENKNINLDLFRLGDNIFINTVNEAVSQATFYRDVNPLQCKNIINNHMGLNVSSLFEDLIPSQEKIIMRLNETQDAYEAAIEKYECTIEKLKKAVDECSSEENKEKLESAIKTATEKLETLKKEYKGWQKDVKSATTAKDDEAVEDDDDEEVSGDGNPRQETTSEPIDAKEVDDVMPELSTPIGDEADGDVTDSEFADYLGAEDSSDVDTIPELPVDGEDDLSLNTDSSDVEDVILTDTDSSDDLVDENPFDITDDSSDELDMEDPVLSIDADTEIPVVTDGDDTDDVDDMGIADIDDTDIEDGESFTTDGEEPVIEPNDEDDIDPDAATDLFGGDLKDPLGTNTEDLNNSSSTASPAAYKIANVMFDANIKTGEKYKSGSVSVIVPMVSGEGKMYIDNQTYNFYINDNGDVVVDNEEMTADLYLGICNAIKNDASFADVVKNGVDDPEAKANAEKADDVKNVMSTWIDHTDEDENDGENEVTPTITDDPDSWSVSFDEDEPDTLDFDTTSEDSDDNVSLDNIFDDFMGNSEDDAQATAEPTDAPVIPTYKSGDTEIELPAANIDDTNIPEATPEDAIEAEAEADDEDKDTIVAESRKSIINIKPVFEKDGKRFFLNEGTIKPSKKGTKNNATLVSEKIDGGIDTYSSPLNTPIEVYSENTDPAVFQLMHDKATYAKIALASYGHIIKVTPIEYDEDDMYELEYFTIEDMGSVSDVKSYTVYQMNNKIYHRPSMEFYQILQDIEDNVPGASLDLLLREYNKRKKLSALPLKAKDDCIFMVNSIIQSLTGEVVKDNNSAAVNLMHESCKIRKPKLGSGHDFEQSKLADDILHGDKETRDFEEKVEKDTQKAGVDNPIAPSQPQEQEESVQMRLPNAHAITEKYDITYEPMDKVIYNKEIPAQVLTVSEDNDSISILVQGKTIDVKAKDIEPDPLYFNDLEVIQQFDFDKDKLAKDATNEKPVVMNDLNGKTVGCNIIVDGHKINMYECFVSLDDITESKTRLRVLLEDGQTEEFDKENIQFVEKPYAVIVDSEGKPVRSIKVDPNSYIEAEENDMVSCEVQDKETMFPKSVIKILS